MNFWTPFIRTIVVPYALGLGAFAAVVLTDGTEDLSWVRFVFAVVAWGVVSFVSAYLMGRLWPSGTSGKGPDCERCGEPTRKPFLYNMPNHHWRCEPCEKAVTDILFTAAASGTLTESMLSYTRPLPADRATEK